MLTHAATADTKAPQAPLKAGNRGSPSLESLRQMVLRENQLRLSDEWQQRFAAAELSHDTDWLECVVELQLQVLQEFGYRAKVAEVLRNAARRYPDEPFFRKVPLQVRFNRARNGSLAEGCRIPDVQLLRLDGSATSLGLETGGNTETMVLIGGSHS